MLVAEGQRFLREINTLVDGSPTRFLRILSYGLANLRTRRRTSFHPRGVTFIPKEGVDEPVTSAAGWGREQTVRLRMLQTEAPLSLAYLLCTNLGGASANAASFSIEHPRAGRLKAQRDRLAETRLVLAPFGNHALAARQGAVHVGGRSQAFGDVD